MHSKVRKLAWILGGVTLLGATTIVVACSTDNGNAAPPGPTTTSPTTTPTTTTTTTTTTSTTLPDGAPNPTGDVDCGFAPRLRPAFVGDAAAPDATASFFCPFGDGGTGGSTDKRFCGAEQTCCAGQGPAPFDTTFCAAPKAAACPVGAKGARGRWECGSKETCGGGEKCCIPGTDAGPPTVDTEKVNGKTCPPEFQRGFYIGGTACRTACQSGELEVCTSDSDCVSPKKCVAFSTNNRDLGACK
jgi:hypothetical protein